MYKQVSSGIFTERFMQAARAVPLIAKSCSTLEEFSRVSKCFLEEDSNSGYAIHEGELCFVFSRFKGRGDAIVESALSNGATHLSCFDGYLRSFYKRHGFVVVEEVPNWKDGEPAVLYMNYVGEV